MNDTNVQTAQNAAIITTGKINNKNDARPLFLALSRKGLFDTQLVDPNNNTTIYRIRDTGRGSLSSKPDYEIYRSSHGDLFIGSIRFGRTSIGSNLVLTNTKSKDITHTILHNNNEYTWKVIKSQPRAAKERWVETNDNGIAQIFDSQEVIVLHLVGANGGDPICVVRLNNTQPTGRFEFWIEDALVNDRGNWHVLDQLVVSAYANMERAKRDLMSGLDPSSWRGAAY